MGCGILMFTFLVVYAVVGFLVSGIVHERHMQVVSQLDEDDFPPGASAESLANSATLLLFFTWPLWFAIVFFRLIAGFMRGLIQ